MSSVVAASVCPSCAFQNPRAWRACARCGRGLTTAPPATSLSAIKRVTDQTVVSASPTMEQLDRALETDVPTEIPIDDLPTPAPADDAETQEGDAETPLIGQAEASEVIRTAVERAFTIGTPTFVALEGARESGKTRLLVYASEIAARVVPDVRVLYAACRKGGGDGPYAPFSRLLLDRFGVTPASSPSTVRGQMATQVSEALATKDAIQVAETTHLIGHVAGVPFPDSPFLTPLEEKPDELRRRAARAVRRVLEGDALKRPLLVLLDDMHFVEEDGWELLAELAKADGHLAILIAGDETIGARAEKLETAGGVAVGPIAPLNEQDVAAMLYVHLPTLVEVPPALAEAITHRARGNPGAVRELVFELVESGLFRPTTEGLEVDFDKLETGGLPVTLEDAIQARLGRLDGFERATLERAAVVGETFWDGAILAQMRAERQPPGDDAHPATIWPDDEDLEALHSALARLVEKGFIDRSETSDLPGAREYTFALAGARKLVYEAMDDERRVARHTAIARWLMVTAELQREGVAGLIAPHLEKAGMSHRAGRAYLEAAAYERNKLRTQTALRLVERAIPLISKDDVVRKIEAFHEHGSLLTTLGRYDEAVESFTEMLRLAWTIGARGKGGAALNRLARVYRQRGEDARARELLERALVMFRSAGDLRGVASTLDDLAQVHRLLAENDLATAAATEALEIRRTHADARGEAVSLTTLGTIELTRGNLDLAESYFSQALEIRRSIGDAEGTMQSHNALAIVAFERGAIDTAIASWEAALEQAREMADRRNECFMLNNLGEAHLAAGRLDDGMEALEEARDLAATLGDRRALAEVERNLGRLAVRQGSAEAEKTLERALTLAEEYGSKEAIALAHRAIGQLRAQTLFDASGGIDRRAEESFLVSIDLFRDIGNEKEAARSLSELGYHLIERGDVEGARERLREARALMRAMGLAELERVDRTLAEIG